MRDDILDRIIHWAKKQKDIRLLILEGSKATKKHTDIYSDYDINVYSNDYSKHLKSVRWIKHISNILIYQKEQFHSSGSIIPTRLVVFKNGQKVDFSFWKLELISEMIKSRKYYKSYHAGFNILLDKDNLSDKMKVELSDPFKISRPSKDHFLQTIHDFWFEAYCVSKYLKRSDLWLAKSIENGPLKNLLLRMFLWHTVLDSDGHFSTELHIGGKRLEKWLHPNIQKHISQCFSRYNINETWRSLFSSLSLFGNLARIVSKRLKIDYPSVKEQEILHFLMKIKSIKTLKPIDPSPIPGLRAGLRNRKDSRHE